MKNKILKNRWLLFAGCIIYFASCKKYQEYLPFDYPPQQLYLSAAANGIYDASMPPEQFEVPTPGAPDRFRIDETAGKLIIPLSVIRSGIEYDGAVGVALQMNMDTVQALIDSGEVEEAVALPADKITFPENVRIEDGSDAGGFELSVDLNYVKQYPDTTFLFSVSISSNDREVRPALQTAIISFNTKALSPEESSTDDSDM